MTNEQIIALVEGGSQDKLKSFLDASKESLFNTATKSTSTAAFPDVDRKQYNPKLHDVHDNAVRKDKQINDAEGRPSATIPVTRLSIPEQKKIVLMAATFLGSPELSSSPSDGIETDLLSVINTVFEDNKLDYKFREITKTTMSERECAELWYTQPAEPDYWAGTPMEKAKFKLRMRVLSPSRGDTLYPVFDSSGDMTAFGRYYETNEFVVDKQVKVLHFDVYTADMIYFMTKSEGSQTWGFKQDNTTTDEGATTTAKGVKNIIGKIPVIYYSQPEPEWYDVQEMIDRLEKKISNHGDTNDYFDSPIVFAEGDVTGFSEKGEQGKVLQGKNGSKVSYLEWNMAPESMKMEIENLRGFINNYTHTPDISFDNMKGLGVFSGIALKMFFMDAHLKAGDKEELFGQGAQRRINYLKAAIAVINIKFKSSMRLKITPKFTYFLPKDVDGEVTTLVNAYSAGIISLETAVKLNPLVSDAVTELERIKADQQLKEPVLPSPEQGGGSTGG